MEEVDRKSILFLTLVAINDIDDRNIYADLMRYFVALGHHVTVVSPIERRHKMSTFLKEGEGYKIIRPKSLNNQKVNKFEKILGLLSIDFVMKRAIEKYVKTSPYLVIYSTPPIMLTRSIRYAKKMFNCKTYLLLKDIFPQNAVDLGMMRKGSFLYIYFRKVEEELYRLSDHIGCMSQANVDYVLKHNSWIESSKVTIAPNSIANDQNEAATDRKSELRSEFDIPVAAKVLIYGGNLGKPQGIPFLIKLLEQFCGDPNVYFVIIGSGTEYQILADWYQDLSPANVLLKSYLPKQKYDSYVEISDIGLVFLDSKFTIPNYPSRVLSYMQAKLPILAFTDEATDVGKNALLRGYGDWAFSGDLDASTSLVREYMAKSPAELESIGKQGFLYLQSNYRPQNTAKQILNI